jgi:glycosyltransferase involved in cell wall biosynthesis
MALKIAIDMTPLLTQRTGIGTLVERMMDELRDRRDVELVPYVLSMRADVAEGVRRFPYPARAALFAWARGRHPRGRRTLRGADVVHGTNYVVPPTGWPTVVSVHDVSFVSNPALADPTIRSFVPVIRRAVAEGAWVHTISEHVAEQVRGMFGAERVRVVYPGATRTEILPGSRNPLPGISGRYVVAIGTHEPRKNFPRLVAAFGILAVEHPDVSLVLAGPPGPDDPAIAAAIALLPRAAAERVVVTDWLDEQHRDAVLAGAAVLAYPSLDEGFGFPALEGMAAGIPVVAARAGAIPEVVADAALLADPLDPAAMAAGLATALFDEDERARLVAAGRHRVLRFTWGAMADGMVALYSAAAGGSSR